MSRSIDPGSKPPDAESQGPRSSFSALRYRDFRLLWLGQFVSLTGSQMQLAAIMIFFMGGPQLGELEAGALAALIGAPLSVATGGIGCLIAVVCSLIWSKKLLHYEGEK